jgi:hypothetical protein
MTLTINPPIRDQSSPMVLAVQPTHRGTHNKQGWLLPTELTEDFPGWKSSYKPT